MPIITYPNIIYPLATTTEVEIVPVGNRRIRQEESKYYNPELLNDTTPWVEGNYMPKVVDYNEFPIGGPSYERPLLVSNAPNGIAIQPWMHQTSGVGADIGLPNTNVLNAVKEFFHARYVPNKKKFAYQPIDHVTSRNNFVAASRDAFDNAAYDNKYPIEHAPGAPNTPLGYTRLYPYNAQYKPLHQFRGAMTELNPENSETKQLIMDQQLEAYDKHITQQNSTSAESQASPETPTSPLHPFMRIHPNRAHHAIVTSYNRTRLPIADIEHRKAFRYIFITRPECYLMASDRPGLCMQAERDEDISTTFARMPHVIKALCPVYQINANSVPHYANWNYLLCNRVMSLNAGGNTLSLVDSMTKGVRGATITPGKLMTGNLGGTLELSFRDTKYMEVYEMLRSWMWYVHKRKIGKFFPPFNGYQYSNDFAGAGSVLSAPNMWHPYDRALEYCCSIWDVLTDETGMNILYWCKYYGLFPTQVSSGMLSATQNGAAINGEATISAQFQYQYKRENVFKNLVEFNYNAGIVDGLGNSRMDVSGLANAISHLNRENGNGGVDATSNVLLNYNGAASMFTGSPFIVSYKTNGMDPWTGTGGNIIKSQLCFLPAGYVDSPTGLIEQQMNLRIVNASPVGRKDIFT